MIKPPRISFRRSCARWLVDRIRQHPEGSRSLLTQCSIRAVFVVVRHVLREDLLEMTATEDEESVETLSTGRAYESLDDRVALSAEHLGEPGAELRVSVPDEELDCSGTLG